MSLIEVCGLCGAPSSHSRTIRHDTERFCCRCWVLEADGSPADWHIDCMESWLELHREEQTMPTKQEPPPTDRFERELDTAFNEMIDLLVKKRQAYGPHNLIRFGGIGIAIRASDKIDRLANLYQRGEVESADGECIEDAFKDLIGYGVLGLLYARGTLVGPGE